MRRYHIHAPSSSQYEEAPDGEWVEAEEALKLEAMLEDSLRTERELLGWQNEAGQSRERARELQVQLRAAHGLLLQLHQWHGPHGLTSSFMHKVEVYLRQAGVLPEGE